MGIFEFLIGRPLGFIMSLFYSLCNNFSISIILFTLFVTLALMPLDIRQQKTMAKQARLAPKLEALKKKCGDDRQKYQQEMAELYQRENVSLTGGCLVVFIRFPILIGVYGAIRNPLSYILNISSEAIASAKQLLIDIGIGNPNMTELDIIRNVGALGDSVPEVTNAAHQLNFNFLGLDLSQQPDFSINIFKDFQMIWLIPILACVCSLITAILSSYINKKNNPQAKSQLLMMIILGPVLSLIIAFTVPGAVGFYWACSNLFGGILRVVISQIYTPNKINAKTDFKLILKRRKEEELIKEKSKNSAAQQL